MNKRKSECPSLNLRIRLLKVDGHYSNTCLTQTLNPYFLNPSSWKYTTLNSVCLKPLIYSHPYVTRAKTMPKPKELKGIKQFGSAQYDFPCKCPLFKEGDNLWIKHRHYFDEWKVDPTKSVFSGERLVCHPNLVYIKIENFFLHLDDQFLKHRILEQQKIALKFNSLSLEWERFWESVICCSKNFRGDI